MRIFRIENLDTMHGMWYDGEGKYNPYITNLTDGRSAHLPMGYNPVHRTDGKEWFSGCDSKEQMGMWFSKQDAEELYAAGYILYEYEAEEVLELEHEVLFTREGITSKKAIPLEVVWG